MINFVNFMTKRENTTLTSHQQKYIAWHLVRQRYLCNEDKFTSVLAEAQVDLYPLQVDAALFSFHFHLSMGAIVSDEAGLGKTIKAAPVIRFSEQGIRTINIFHNHCADI